MTPDLSLIADAVVIALLLVALVGGWRLNRRLATLRDDRGALEQVVQALATASAQAQSSVQNLRAGVEEANATLGPDLTKARGLIEELVLIIEAGDRLANRLETAARGAGSAAVAARGAGAVSPAPPSAEETVADRLRPLLDGLRGIR